MLLMADKTIIYCQLCTCTFLLKMLCYAGFEMFQVPKYLAHVDRRLREENDRLLHYLDQSTR